MKQFLKLLIPTFALGLVSCGGDEAEKTFEEEVETTREILINNVNFVNEASNTLGINIVFGECTINASNQLFTAKNKADLDQLVDGHNKCLADKVAHTAKTVSGAEISISYMKDLAKRQAILETQNTLDITNRYNKFVFGFNPMECQIGTMIGFLDDKTKGEVSETLENHGKCLQKHINLYFGSYSI